MKLNIHILLTTLGLTSLFLGACDNIDENDRYYGVEKPAPPVQNVPKNLLIMEFTGNRCVNCPLGAQTIHNIQTNNPEYEIITVGLHPAGGGPNTQPIGTQDFRTAEAEVMFQYYKPSGFPCAVFNGGVKSTTINTWPTLAVDYFGEEADMSIDIENIYDDSTREVTVNYKVNMTNDVVSNLSVMVWIMENNIVGYQLDGGELLSDYVHNHVLRDSLNGDWGTQLPNPLYNGDVIEGTASMTLNEAWVAENCQILVYVFQTDSKLVEQSQLADVINITED